MNYFPGEDQNAACSLNPFGILEGKAGSIFKLFSKGELELAQKGELYLTEVIGGVPKRWRKHTRVTCRLVVISGSVEFTVMNGGGPVIHTLSLHSGRFLEIHPGVWFCFKVVGTDDRAIVMNLIDEPHDPSEVEQLPPDLLPLGRSK